MLDCRARHSGIWRSHLPGIRLPRGTISTARWAPLVHMLASQRRACGLRCDCRRGKMASTRASANACRRLRSERWDRQSVACGFNKDQCYAWANIVTGMAAVVRGYHEFKPQKRCQVAYFPHRRCQVAYFPHRRGVGHADRYAATLVVI